MWMIDIAATWLMSTLTTSATLVALVQTMSALPTFLFALPAGALADFMDRRLTLLWSQLWMTFIASILAVMSFLGALTPITLLALVFSGGIGFAVRWPVSSSLVPQAVPPDDLAQAMALNAVAVNFSRVAGPLLAGLFLAAFGPGWVFTLGAALWLTSLIVFLFWRPQKGKTQIRRNTSISHAMLASVRHSIRHPLITCALQPDRNS